MKEKCIPALSAFFAGVARYSVVLLVVLVLAGCGQAQAPAQPAPSANAAAIEVTPPTATPQPSPTATLPPTATPEPSATPTQPPTATPVPALALVENGFDAWCAPIQYAGIKPFGPDAPEYANKMVAKGSYIRVRIPATFCTMIYKFNQAAPSGTTLTFYDGKNPFLKLPLQAAEGHPDEVWTSVTHSYVIDPPLWYVEFRLSVTGPDGKELWSNPVLFSKPLPPACPAGGYPDPVTMYCNPFDPREIEPHPEDPDYPYNDMFQ